MNNFKQDLWYTIESDMPFISLLTHEEARAISVLKELADEKGYIFYDWSLTKGLIKHDKTEIRQISDTRSDETLIKKIFELFDKSDSRSLVVLKDFTYKDEKSCRSFKDLAEEIRQKRKITIIFLSAAFPPVFSSIENDDAVMNFPLPEFEEIQDIFQKIADTNDLTENTKTKLYQSVQGLTLNEIERTVRKAKLEQEGIIDENSVSSLQKQKKEIIKKQQLLEFYTSDDTLHNIGGLKNLKDWLEYRKYAWNEEAESFGIDKPSGIILTGVPGCGKSLVCKAIAKLWELPLLSLDVGKLFGSLVGQTEENLRKAILTAEAVSPCVLWIDEIDKGFGGVSGAQGDSGTLLRVFGSFLTWMQEKSKPVFVVVTCNHPELLPAPFWRSGRWDQTFFVDLPDFYERIEIFDIHLQKKKRQSHSYDRNMLSAMTEGFSGAEIEQVVKNALFKAFKRKFDKDSAKLKDKDDLSQSDLIDSVKRTLPLSHFQREEIQRIRAWAKARTVNASYAKSDITQYELKEEELEVIALHETSHAVVAWKLWGLIPTRLSVEITQYMQPYTMMPFSKPLGLYTQDDIINEITVLLAGRIGEIRLSPSKKPYSGASDDIQRATTLARHAVTQLSLSESDNDAMTVLTPDALNPDSRMLEDINAKIKNIILQGREKATDLVLENKELIKKISETLKERRLLLDTELTEILSNKD